MKKMLIAAILALATATAAQAFEYDYALQVRAEFRHEFIDARPWQSLYYNAPVNGGGATIDSEIAVGLGPYLHIDGMGVVRNITGGITAKWNITEGAFGVNYRIRPISWFNPGVHVGYLYFGARETISDNTFAYHMRHNGSGLDVGVDLDFYPFGFMKDSWARGWDFWLGAGYQTRPLADMGGLTSASGWSLGAGVGFRFDLTPHRKPAAAAPSAAPTPAAPAPAAPAPTQPPAPPPT